MILGLTLCASVPALAQSDAGPVTPKAANPGDEVNPTLLRDLGSAGDDLADAGSSTTPFQQDLQQPAAAPAAPEKKEEPAKPAPGMEPWELSAKLSASVRLAYGGSTTFPFDAEGTTYPVAPFETRVRVSA
jgi:hypothetical protein